MELIPDFNLVNLSICRQLLIIKRIINIRVMLRRKYWVQLQNISFQTKIRGNVSYDYNFVFAIPLVGNSLCIPIRLYAIFLNTQQFLKVII